MYHIMFDIDGTLIQSNDFDANCFIEAVKESIGIKINDNWSNYKNVTDSGILNEIIISHNLTNQAEEIHKTVKEIFVHKIHNHLKKNSIYEIEGASSFLSELKKNNQVVLSIATGGWYESAILKLQYANIDFKGIPIVSSNKYFSRTEIMKSAEKIINSNICKTTYFGDGAWDKEACEILEYNFIAVGNNIEHYQKIKDYNSMSKAMSYIGL